MKKYLYNKKSPRTLIALDEENIINTTGLESTWLEYDVMFLIEEDGVLYIEDKQVDVKCGDFVLILRAPYSKYETRAIVISNEDLYDNLIKTRAYYQEQKRKEMAALEEDESIKQD